MRDDLIFDLVVRRLRNDLLSHQVTLGVVRAIVDDLLRVGITNSRKRLQLIIGCSVDVELLARSHG